MRECGVYAFLCATWCISAKVHAGVLKQKGSTGQATEGMLLPLPTSQSNGIMALMPSHLHDQDLSTDFVPGVVPEQRVRRIESKVTNVWVRKRCVVPVSIPGWIHLCSHGQE